MKQALCIATKSDQKRLKMEDVEFTDSNGVSNNEAMTTEEPGQSDCPMLFDKPTYMAAMSAREVFSRVEKVVSGSQQGKSSSSSTQSGVGPDIAKGDTSEHIRRFGHLFDDNDLE